MQGDVRKGKQEKSMRIDYTEVRRLYNVAFVDYEMSTGREVVENLRKEAS